MNDCPQIPSCWARPRISRRDGNPGEPGTDVIGTKIDLYIYKYICIYLYVIYIYIIVCYIYIYMMSPYSGCFF